MRLLLPIILLASGIVSAQTESLQMTVSVSEVVASSKVFSQRFNLTEDKAYKFQHSFVKNAQSKGALAHGYKAGLVSQPAQQKYGVEKLITGVLLTEPLLAANKPIIKLDGSKDIYMEIEMAYQLKSSITEPVKNIEALKGLIARTAPAIELPNANFTRDDFNGFDIIANNALAYRYIVGQWSEDFSGIDNQNISLSCDDKLVGSVVERITPPQWEILLQMVNHLVTEGFSLRAGNILLSGNLGKLLPAKPCQYKADFGHYGSFEYTIQP